MPPFDFAAMMNAFSDHPFVQRVQSYVNHNMAQGQGARGGAADANNSDENENNNDDFGDDNTFVPPVDVFNTANNWTVHIALPGAKKEDLAINWDAHKGQLAVSGVVYRPGNEEFLSGMISGERKVGLFERKIKLPPLDSDDRDEVDGDAINARMEDGVLIVTVPKAEKEWTEVRKVDIE
jgi:HSP20 family protein